MFLYKDLSQRRYITYIAKCFFLVSLHPIMVAHVVHRCLSEREAGAPVSAVSTIGTNRTPAADADATACSPETLVSISNASQLPTGIPVDA